MFSNLSTKKNIYKILISFIILVSVSTLLADDDDDEDEGHEHRTKNAQTVSKSSGTQLGELGIAPERMNAAFKKECASCHMLYVPGLLPARSWNKMMNSLDKHFGENATLDAATEAEIRKFLSDNAADMTGSRRGRKISDTLSLSEAPQRFSDTKYFVRKHHEVSADVYKRKAIGSAANCIACHGNAENGNFNEHEVKIPK